MTPATAQRGIQWAWVHDWALNWSKEDSKLGKEGWSGEEGEGAAGYGMEGEMDGEMEGKGEWKGKVPGRRRVKIKCIY